MKNKLLKKKIKIKKIVSAASTLSLKDKLDFKKKKIILLVNNCVKMTHKDK